MTVLFLLSFLVIMLPVGIRGLFEYYTTVDHISFPYGHGQLTLPRTLCKRELYALGCPFLWAWATNITSGVHSRRTCSAQCFPSSKFLDIFVLFFYFHAERMNQMEQFFSLKSLNLATLSQ
jgi:hypothetical protein